jgi:hypothetical protein
MFERLEIWERTEECIWIYVLFRDLETGLFHVQQANAVYPSTPDSMRTGFETKTSTTLELFSESSPSERSLGFLTAEKAVAHHKGEFADILHRPPD